MAEEPRLQIIELTLPESLEMIGRQLDEFARTLRAIAAAMKDEQEEPTDGSKVDTRRN